MMELWKIMAEQWTREIEEELIPDVNNDPFNPDDDPWYDEENESDPFDPTGEKPVDLYGPWWE